MKSVLKSALFLCVFFILPLIVHAEDFMAQGNALFEKGKTNLESYKEAGDMFVKALEANPNSYEAAWKAARSYRYFADESKKKNTQNWKAVCKEYGKLGMKYGEKAIALNQNGVEGNTWYGFSVGELFRQRERAYGPQGGVEGQDPGQFRKGVQGEQAVQ
jgi:tetratricopeptide (TPR) repeat protein